MLFQSRMLVRCLALGALSAAVLALAIEPTLLFLAVRWMLNPAC
jgi:hypothetical protein